MPMPRKAVLYNELKEAKERGAQFDFPGTYVTMTEATLEELHDKFVTPASSLMPEDVEVEDYDETSYPPIELPDEPSPNERFAALMENTAWEEAVSQVQTEPAPDRESPWEPEPVAPPTTRVQPGLLKGAQPQVDDGIPPVRDWANYSPQTLARLLNVPLADRGDERAGLRINTHGPDDVLRIDSEGKVWYQDEVPKPAIPKPRMRRRVRYIDPGVKTVERRLPDGKLDESFEVAGDNPHEAEYKVTLPSWQTGIYYDTRLPFRVHVYNGRRGFDRMDVVRYYGGSDLVPTSVQENAIYVGNDLCYDILKVRDAMERELRELSGVINRQSTF